MAVRALCIRLLMMLVTLLCAHEQKADAVSLHIVPNRLQFFEYESVIFYCEGAVYWEVVHNINGKINLCSHTNKKTPAGSFCTIKNVYKEDSGEYWCETKEGKRSNTINIAVTAVSVILEVPAVPVMEGEAVTLRCRNKTTSSNFTSNFYKDGRRVHRSSTGEMTIQRVSKSDEGLYKCNISGAGESPESWLNVTVNPDSYKEMSLFSSAATPWVISTIVLSFLLVVVGLYQCGKSCWERASTKADGSGSTENQTDDRTVNAAREEYAVVRKSRKMEDEDGLSSRPISSFDQGDAQLEESGPITKTSSAGIYQPIEEDPFYSTIHLQSAD
ncbi:high affinity immunoglobulin gamma Fc receptor I-like [Archocentrus centrarchus]|uniref:high affinity immunoglobulin gamma Fc receptor I-like n=1 Tax=Archocentrus centrarchus TaxID=63155 RepID=UPI0011EA245B|nr:high affinity immunoglobulin gamma Fc receptor I-like [Archocentrus centrarchus]